MSVTSWFLVSSTGIRHRLPREMIFVGRDDCELMLQVNTRVDYAGVLNDCFLEQTFVNDVRIPDQKYITLKLNDVIRFGYDILFVIVQTALLFLFSSLFPFPEAAPYRTPLYGQPSWWGEDDANNKLERPEERRQEEHYSERTKERTQHEEEIKGNISGYRDPQDQSVYSFRREPSYFEIPTKEFQQPAKPSETQVHEIPTKDVDAVVPPVVQSHASFTIEFDDCTPGKIKIKDHVTKFSLRQRRHLGKEPDHSEMMSAESKVADWLVQNDPSLMRRQSPGDDVYSTKSDLPVHVRTLKGNRHEDGTQSDSEEPVPPKAEKETTDSDHAVEQARLQRQIRRDPQEMLHNQQAFVIEFFDDDTPRKKRSQSFTHSAHSSQSDTDPALKAKVEKRKTAVPAEKPGSAVPLPPHNLVTPGGKPASSTSTTQRASSFKREKTEDRISSSTSKTSGKNYGSIGRKSKIAQDFAAEFLRESTPAGKASAEKPAAVPVPVAPRVVISSAPEAAPISAVDPKLVKARKHDEEDSLSETGTYTIETESQDKEVEEARKMIDQVKKKQHCCYKPAFNTGKNTLKQWLPKYLSMNPTSHGGQKWVSRWASLADTYTESGSVLYDVVQQRLPTEIENGSTLKAGEAETITPSRTRRLLPQLPPSEKSESPTPTILICQEPFPEAPKRNVNDHGTEGYMDPTSRLFIQEDLDPDSLSDASKSDDGFALEKGRKYKENNKMPEQERLSVVKEVSNTYISTNGKMVISLHQGLPQEQESVATKEISSLVRQESFTKDKSSSVVPQNKLPHISSHPLLKDLDVARSSRMDYNQDTQLFLKETETALAALEAKILCQTHPLDPSENIPGQLEDSLSGDSEVDTASTVSLVSGKNVPTNPPKRKVVSGLQKEKSSSTPSIQDQCSQPSARERLSEKRKMLPPDTGNRGETAKGFQMRRSTGTRGSLDFTDDERSTSLHFLPATETASSDNEHSVSRPLARRKQFSPSTKEEHSKVTPTAQKIQQVLTRSNSLSTPRPTRASKLRRARLGDASDNECADAEKTASHLEATTASSKQSAEAKKLSRLDILAMPRKRAGSFTVPSDSETAPPRTGFSGRSGDSYYSNRKPAMSEARTAARKTVAAAAATKQPFSRTRSSSVKYSSSSTSRRRQQGSDYTSTSEEEYGSNHSSPKHKRSHTSTATQTSRRHGSGLSKQKHSGRETDDDEDFEPDPYNFIAQTAEIAEIARLSQTLVKDVAILAREIHDVAGDGDSQSSSGTGPSTSLSSVPNTPASTISAREEIVQASLQAAYSSQLVQHIPEASLNYQKVPPGSMEFSDFDQNMNDSREEDLQRKTRTRNREEVIFDNLMLNPVSQLSHTIRENTENLAEKMKVLFQNNERTWEELEAKINSENEVPILKTSNKEISSILKELRRVQKQLEVINAVIEPSGNLDLATSNKESSAATQSATMRVRTANLSGSVLESLSPVQMRNFTPKSNCGSSSLQDANFIPDGEKYVI
uniref:Centrosomal protein 170B n=1 Tax=Sphenodon punctatus TaxID=8508 RepID=A0A8D0GVP2_SPHPU